MIAIEWTESGEGRFEFQFGEWQLTAGPGVNGRAGWTARHFGWRVAYDANCQDVEYALRAAAWFLRMELAESALELPLAV